MATILHRIQKTFSYLFPDEILPCYSFLMQQLMTSLLPSSSFSILHWRKEWLLCQKTSKIWQTLKQPVLNDMVVLILEVREEHFQHRIDTVHMMHNGLIHLHTSLFSIRCYCVCRNPDDRHQLNQCSPGQTLHGYIRTISKSSTNRGFAQEIPQSKSRSTNSDTKLGQLKRSTGVES